jgi:acetyl esterase
MKRNVFVFFILLTAGLPSLSQPVSRKILYKQIDTIRLYLEMIAPENAVRSEKPAMIFFFGGGWNSGYNMTIQSLMQNITRKKRDNLCFLAEYRVSLRHKSSPFEALKDAKSAIRFIRQHADEFMIDTSKIIASGGSAGGHLAAATAFIRDFNEATDDLSISCVPNALVLFNPVIDNGPGGYGYERIGEKYKDFSPLHNINKGAPPTIFFLGTKDHHIPVETARYYKTVMEKVGSRCDLSLFDGEGHGFFNYKNSGKLQEDNIRN